MLEIEYDHRSLKAKPSAADSDDWYITLAVVAKIKELVPANCRIYNKDTKVWFMPESYIKLVRERTAHLDVVWLKRI